MHADKTSFVKLDLPKHNITRPTQQIKHMQMSLVTKTQRLGVCISVFVRSFYIRHNVTLAMRHTHLHSSVLYKKPSAHSSVPRQSRVANDLTHTCSMPNRFTLLSTCFLLRHPLGADHRVVSVDDGARWGDAVGVVVEAPLLVVEGRRLDVIEIEEFHSVLPDGDLPAGRR